MDDTESDADVLLRIQDQGAAFAHQADRSDDKVNDGDNYKGVLSAADYKKRRVEVLEDPEEKKRDAIAAARNADRDARQRGARELEEREAQRRERIQKQLEEGADTEQESGAADTKKRKKKKKGGELSGLSFDADEG